MSDLKIQLDYKPSQNSQGETIGPSRPVWTLTAKIVTTKSGPQARSIATDAGNPAQPSAIHVKKNDTLTWVTSNGSVSDFVVHLAPARAFDRSTFWKGSPPVKAKKATRLVHAYCGFVYEGKLIGYPKDKKLGHTIPDSG
jgi:hypothetical protein